MTETTLRIASIAFATLWTSFMWWTDRPLHMHELPLLLVCGALVGTGWYFGYGRWFRSDLPTR
jgi:hypothetical protein